MIRNPSSSSPKKNLCVYGGSGGAPPVGYSSSPEGLEISTHVACRLVRCGSLLALSKSKRALLALSKSKRAFACAFKKQKGFLNRLLKIKAEFIFFSNIIMVFIKKAKKYGKGVAKRAYGMAKKRYVKKGQPNIKNIYNDVKLLKHLVNIEKKRFDVTQTQFQGVAQFNTAGNTGQFAAVVTPFPVEGIAQGTRIGLSLKIVSCCFDIQFIQGLSAINDLKVKWYLVCRADNQANTTALNSINAFFEPNPFTNVNDFYSSRDPEYFTAFKVIKNGTINLKQDQLTGGSSIVQKKYPMKLNHHLKFNTDATTVTTKNQFYLFAVASGGDTSLATGCNILYNFRWYYTDN